MKDSSWTKGIRRSVYSLASIGGFHTSEDKNRSIRYEDKTLQIHVVFKDSEAARNFVFQLTELTKDAGDCLSHGDVVEYKKALKLRDFIYEKHYKASDTDSPEATVDMHSSTVVAVEKRSGLCLHQRLQPEVYADAAGFESCLIKGREHCNAHGAVDENNRLALTPSFRKLFDGRGGNSAPKLRIRVLEVDENFREYETGTGTEKKRYQVTLWPWNFFLWRCMRDLKGP